jgi:hypothetical protein
VIHFWRFNGAKSLFGGYESVLHPQKITEKLAEGRKWCLVQDIKSLFLCFFLTVLSSIMQRAVNTR